MNSNVRLSLLAIPLALSLALAGCAPSIEEARATASAEVEAMTYLDPSVKDRLLERIESAQSQEEIDRAVDEGRYENDGVASSVTPIAAAVEPLVNGQRWTYNPQDSDMNFELPAGSGCFIEFNTDGTIAPDSTFLGPECLNVSDRGQATSWDIDPRHPDDVRANNSSGQLVSNFTMTPDEPSQGQVSVQYGNVAPFRTLVFDVTPIS